MYKFREFYIRDQMMKGIKNYVEQRAHPGSFLTAVICNDLKNAVGKADDENMENIPAFVEYFYNHTPYSCWGSKERMEKWLNNIKEKKHE